METKEIKTETLEKETTRIQKLTDLFLIKCKKCGSENVGLIGNLCRRNTNCGITIDAECWDCGSKYCYHDFKCLRVRYSDNGKTETVLGEVSEKSEKSD